VKILSVFDQRSSWVIAIVIILLVYSYIAVQLSNYENPWVLPEMHKIEEAYLKTGVTIGVQDIFRIWDWQINEAHSRVTRWVAWHMDFLDTKFRAWLWQFTFPHPSASLMWGWCLVLNPLLLGIYLRLRRFSVAVVLLVVAFYLMTPETLSGVFMHFRSGKILANFFMLLALVLAWLSEANPRRWLYLVGLCLAMMLSTFADEAGFFVFPLILCIHPKIFIDRRRWWWMAVTLALIFVAYAWGIKAMCHYVSQTPMIGVDQYFVFKRMFQSKYLQYIFINMGSNMVALFTQTMGLAYVHAKASLGHKLINIACAAAWIMLIIKFFKDNNGRLPEKYYISGVILLFIACSYHCFLMSMTENRVWGPYYYDSYFAIPFVLTLAVLLRSWEGHAWWRGLMMSVILCAMGGMFLYTNLVYKNSILANHRLIFVRYSTAAISILIRRLSRN